MIRDVELALRGPTDGALWTNHQCRPGLLRLFPLRQRHLAIPSFYRRERLLQLLKDPSCAPDIKRRRKGEDGTKRPVGRAIPIAKDSKAALVALRAEAAADSRRCWYARSDFPTSPCSFPHSGRECIDGRPPEAGTSLRYGVVSKSSACCRGWAHFSQSPVLEKWSRTLLEVNTKRN